MRHSQQLHPPGFHGTYEETAVHISKQTKHKTGKHMTFQLRIFLSSQIQPNTLDEDASTKNYFTSFTVVWGTQIEWIWENVLTKHCTQLTVCTWIYGITIF
jgi:hypothetical protein